MKGPFPSSSGGAQKATDETLRTEYQEICRSHQAITDFRGKLLGLLPVATGAGIFLLLDRPIKTQTTTFLVAAGIFGAFITIGLYFYEFRGMNECHLLRERGANLEHELQLRNDCSRFQNNPAGFFGPREAGPVVYFAVVAGWIFVSVHGLVSSNFKFERMIGVWIVAGYLIAVLVSVTMAKLLHKRAQ
jgi:hypothetical protein